MAKSEKSRLRGGEKKTEPAETGPLEPAVETGFRKAMLAEKARRAQPEVLVRTAAELREEEDG